MQIVNNTIVWDVGDIHYDIDVDLHNKKQLITVPLHQYDANSVYILSNVWNDSNVYTIPTNAIVTFSATNPNGEGIDNECKVVNNQILYQVTETTTIKDGNFDAEFRIYNTITNTDQTTASALKGSPKFRISVEKSALSNDTIVSANEFNVLTNLINDTQTTINDVNTAKDATITATTNANNATTTVLQTNTTVNEAEQVRISNEDERIAKDNVRPDYIYLTQAEYDALPQADKDNPKYIYEITDDDGEFPTNLQMLINDTILAANNAQNTATNLEQTYAPRLTEVEENTDLAVIDTQTGTSIQSAVADDSVVELKIEGASYQLVTTQGKNICPTSFSEWESGAYIGTDGTKAANSAYIRIKHLVKVSPSSTYYVHTNDTDATYTFQFAIRSYGADGSFKRSIGAMADGATFTTNADEYYIGININDGGVNIATYTTYQTNFGNGTIKPFICLNSETDKSYQAFVPNSPSPEYLAPITNANNFDVVACGKNLLPKFTTQTVYGVTMSVASDGTITLNGTASATFVFNVPMNQLLNGQYNMSANNNVANSEVILRLIAPLSISILSCALSSINATVSTNFTNQTITALNIRIGSGQVLTNFIIKPQLEKGSVVTSYEAYKSNQVNIPYELPKLPNGVSDTIEYIGGGKAKWTKRNNTVVFDGSADETWGHNSTEPKWNSDTTKYEFEIQLANAKAIDNFGAMSDRFKIENFSTVFNATSKPECIVTHSSRYIVLLINKGELSTVDVAGLKTWLASNPITVQYELATPVETIIDLLPLTSYKGITNVFSTSNPQVNITGYFKSRLKNVVETLRAQLASKTQATITVPTFTNAWVVDGVLGYFINAFGELEFVGAIKSGTLGASAFTLAVGYRPLTQKRIPCVSNGAFGYIVIGTDGTVKPYGSNIYISLDGIRTRIDV